MYFKISLFDAVVSYWIPDRIARYITKLELLKGKKAGLYSLLNTFFAKILNGSLKIWKRIFGSKVPITGIVGLINIGNSSYMNSVLQCLFIVQIFSEHFRKDQYNQISGGQKLLSNTFAELSREVQTDNSLRRSIKELLVKLKKYAGQINPTFKTYGQQDALEFLKTFLEGIHTELNEAPGNVPYRQLKTRFKSSKDPIDYNRLSHEWRSYMESREKSIVTEIFSGQLLNEIWCSRCLFHNVAFEPFWDLSLGFNQQSNEIQKLEDMLDKFISKEFLYDSQEICNCESQNIIKIETKIWNLPKVLIIHFKRFKCDGDNDRYKKIKTAVEFPVDCLDMKQFIPESRQPSLTKTKYKLVGVVNHSGSLTSGHYTATCLDLRERKWYNYNDSQREEFLKMKDVMTSSHAYLLFYVNTAYLDLVVTDVEAVD